MSEQLIEIQDITKIYQMGDVQVHAVQGHGGPEVRRSLYFGASP